MGRETGIAWTDHTFNPWWGCTKVSPGCDHCYAEGLDRRTGGAHWGKGAPRRTFGTKHWNEPLLWNELARKEGKRRRVFCASMADVMDDEAPEGQRERLWSTIDATPWLDWQLLTKRPQRYVRFLPALGFKANNVMLGTTVESQEQYQARIDALSHAWTVMYCCSQQSRPASQFVMPLFISYEPALGPLAIGTQGYVLDWLIFGGETGPNRRPMEEQWARDIQAECRQRGVAFFMKQMSAATPAKAAALIPADLLVRDFPEMAA